MISRPPTSNITDLRNMMHMEPFTHDAYIKAYIKYEDQGGVSTATGSNSYRRR
jgi:hypothetical protein